MKKLLLLAAAAWLSALTLPAQTFTVTPNTTTYSPGGGQVTISVSLTYPAGSIPLLEAKPPASTWVHVGTSGTNVPSVLPNAGDTTDAADPNSKWGWSYQEPPTSPANFTFTISYPAGLSGNQVIALNGGYRANNNPLTAVTVAPITLTPTPVAPSITTQPANRSVTSGQNATFSAAASGVPAPTLKWQRSTDSGATWTNVDDGSGFAGTTTGTLTVNAVTLAMSGHRFRVVATATGFAAVNSDAATLTVAQAPVISQQPAAQSALAGGSATFTVVASGSGTITYKWYFTSTVAGSTPQLIPGATTSTLTLTNVQAANQGDYVVVLNNGVGGDVTSNAASLTLVPRLVRVASQSATAGANVVVPIELQASGAENALGFSLNFNPAQLTYVSAALGAQAADAVLNPNVSQIASGRLGIALAKPANATWAAGTQQIVVITFTVNAGLAPGDSAAITFGGTPIVQEISSATANVLPGAYQNGAVSVPVGFEADMNSNGVVTITDWVKVGRIVAGLDAVANGTEFQKADCAGRATLGNGALTISDWVQAGRYAAGLDPLTSAGGPTQPSP